MIERIKSTVLYFHMCVCCEDLPEEVQLSVWAELNTVVMMRMRKVRKGERNIWRWEEGGYNASLKGK